MSDIGEMLTSNDDDRGRWQTALPNGMWVSTCPLPGREGWWSTIVCPQLPSVEDILTALLRSSKEAQEGVGRKSGATPILCLQTSSKEDAKMWHARILAEYAVWSAPGNA